MLDSERFMKNYTQGDVENAVRKDHPSWAPYLMVHL